MKSKLAVLLCFFLLSGCASVRGWENYRTDIGYALPQYPQYEEYNTLTLRKATDNSWAELINYMGGNATTVFGYTENGNAKDWIAMFDDFLAWNPPQDAYIERYTLEHKSDFSVIAAVFQAIRSRPPYTVSYRKKGDKKYFIVKYDEFTIGTDYTEQIYSEDSVRNMKQLYEYLSVTLK